jgi:hypothetical protein
MLIKTAFFFLTYLALPVGLVVGFLGVRAGNLALKISLLVVACVVALPGALLDFDLLLTRNGSEVDPEIVVESWDGVADGMHNSNTDLVEFKGHLFLIHQSSPYHLGTDRAELLIKKSADGGRSWVQIAAVDGGEFDIRDPKFAIVDNTLFLYVLMNVELNPEPFTTLYTWSDDGENWSPLQETGEPEWLFWRAKEHGGRLYTPAYYYHHNRSVLFASEDGRQWDKIADIYEGGRNDETAIAFLSSGEMVATARLEYSDSVFGHRQGSTLIARSFPPYGTFEVTAEDRLTRLDGPRLFTYEDRVFAVARYQPRTTMPWQMMGSAFTRKRTSIFEVRHDGLIRISDLPSAGDTSYAGLVYTNDPNEALVCYYTSTTDRDYSWFTGLLSPSAIRMARIDMASMLVKADALIEGGGGRPRVSAE